MTTNWRELIDTWTDDDIPIPHDSVRFLSDQVGYVVMGESLASTIDGGKSWSIWDAKKEVPNWHERASLLSNLGEPLKRNVGCSIDMVNRP
jgi:photosystem II stability/assembly factor-like uncharacterized protein